MKSTARRLPAGPIALAAALLTGILVLFAPASAMAHDVLLTSSPEADSTVDTLPAELTLTFSAEVIDAEGATEIVVTDAAGTSVTNGALAVNGGIITQPLIAEAEAGQYHVIWKIVSSDGHATSGEFSFTVANSSVVTPSAAPEEDNATAAPEETLAASPEPTATQSPEEAGDTTGIWALAAIAVVVIIAVVVVLIMRRRNGTSAAPEESADH